MHVTTRCSCNNSNKFQCALSLTDERVGDMRPVNAVLQLELVVGLDVEQEVLVEAHPGNQVSPVGTLQCTVAVDVL